MLCYMCFSFATESSTDQSSLCEHFCFEYLPLTWALFAHGLVPTFVHRPLCGPYDAVDTHLPAVEEGAVFVASSFFVTPNQTRGLCESAVPCTTDADCPAGGSASPDSPATGSQYLTGTCMTSLGLCQQAAWCPAEQAATATVISLKDTANFTLFFRVDGSFADFRGHVFHNGDDV